MLYWQKSGSDSFGKPIYADPTNPVVMAVRWEDKQQEIITADGRKVMTKGYLLLASNVAVGSLVFLGGGKDPKTDWTNLPTYPNVPTVLQGGREILLVNATPDIKNQGTIYEAYL